MRRHPYFFRHLTGRGWLRLLVILFFLGPALALVVFFYFVPIALTVLISFTDMDHRFEWEFVGLSNFYRILGGGDPLIPRIVVNTVVYVGSALAFTILGALLVSLSAFRMNPVVGSFFRSVFFLPRSIPPVVWAFIWSWSFEGTRFGVFNSILEGLGFEPVFWFTKYPMLIVVLANGFLGISLAMLVFSSALSMIPRELLDAAEVDGASYFRTSLHIIIPMLKWPIFTMVVWHLMSFINSYVYILLITEGGPYYATEVWALYGYDSAFKYFRYGYGSSLMMILVVVNTLLFLAVWRGFGVRRLMEALEVRA